MDTQIKVGVLIVDKDKVLLLKEWSNAKQGYFWNFVKGTFDSSIDKTVAGCAKREAKEEAGVEVELKNFINIAIKHGAIGTRIYINFIGEIIGGKPAPASLKDQEKRKEDIKEVKWVKRKELEKISKEEFISDVVYLAILNWMKGKVYPLELVDEIVLTN